MHPWENASNGRGHTKLEKVPVYYYYKWGSVWAGLGCIYGPVIKCDSGHLLSCHSQSQAASHPGDKDIIRGNSIRDHNSHQFLIVVKVPVPVLICLMRYFINIERRDRLSSHLRMSPGRCESPPGPTEGSLQSSAATFLVHSDFIWTFNWVSWVLPI